MTTIISKSGTGVPAPDKLETAELAVDVSSGDLYTKLSDNSVVQINGGSANGGTGSSVHIGENPPADPQEGQQWMEVPTDGDATMWIYDGGKWLQQPGGKDGAPGADGNIADGTQEGIVATWNDTTGQWTPEPTVIVNGGNVGIGGIPEGASIYDGANLELNGSDTERGSRLLMKNPANKWAITSFSNGPTNDLLNFYSFQQGGNVLQIDGTTGDATFSGKATFGNPNAKTILNERIHIVGADGPALPSDYSGGAVAAKDFLIVENNGNSNMALVGNTGSYPSIKFNVYDPAVDAHSYNGIVGYKDAAKHLEFAMRDYQYDSDAGEEQVAAMFLKHSGDASSYIKSTRLEVRGDIVANHRLFKNTNTEVTGVDDLVRVLSTLRNATKDETTLEGLRDSIGNAIGGLIEEFENQIATMPAEDEA